MTDSRPLNVVIVEDERHLAELHREFIEQNFHLHVAGIAGPLEHARELISQRRPRLVLLDNYLPDGQLPKWAIWSNKAYGTTYEPAVFVYNKRLIPAADVPDSHAALAKLIASQFTHRG